MRHVLEVPVQAHRLGIDVVAGDTDLASGLFHLEEVLVGRGVDEFETGGFPAQDAAGEVVGGGGLQQRAGEEESEDDEFFHGIPKIVILVRKSYLCTT